MSDEACVICMVKDDRPKTKLGAKGCNGLLAASRNKGGGLVVTPGQLVHEECRRVYCHPNQLRETKVPAFEDTNNISSPKTRRSVENKFLFESKCLFCGHEAKHDRYKRGHDVFPVRTLEFQKTVKDICLNRNDEWGNTVLSRIEYAQDLPAVEARYHQICSSNFRTGYQVPSQYSDSNNRKKGRPIKDNVEEAFKEVTKFFETHENDQITICDLVYKMFELCQNEAYSTTHMKKKIIEYFGDAIIISELNGKHDVVTFKSKAHSILHSFYKRERKNDNESEKEAIIKTAAKLIRTDIKSMDYSKEVYPTGCEIMTLESNLKHVPSSLEQFLRNIIDNHQEQKKIASIGQAIVQASIPRGVIAPLQIGLGVQMHHLYGSKLLVDTLNSLGFCSSYQEVLKYESNAAAVNRTVIQCTGNEFVQYVADNVDHNTCTLDGLNTFHGMGIIATITPKLEMKRIIPRINVTPEDILKVGKISIHYYSQKSNNIEDLKFKELINLQSQDTSDDTTKELEFLIKIAKPLKIRSPGWSGMMQMLQMGEFPGQSSVMYMPMIDMSASDMSCIYSTLQFVADQSRQVNRIPILTFDQPLYWKALNIVKNEPPTSNIKDVILRLGGFHTEMSFLGCIGRIMENTGLEELLGTVYAENTVSHMLNGKAINRAIRGHFLVDDALQTVLFEKVVMQNDDHQTEKVKGIIQSIVEEKQVPDDICTDSDLKDLMNRHEQVKVRLLKYKTARIWLQYMDMVELLKTFIKAERMGNWKLHLKSLHEMLPYMASAGHNLYLKSGYIYLQEMMELEEKYPEVHKAFCDGYHVVRRSDRFWAGLSTDLVIEQVLMRSVKSVGGLTRGRGLSETQRTQWLMAMPATSDINMSMQNFTEQELHTSEQHKETKHSRIGRDEKDRDTLVEFLTARNPFASTEDTDLRNIETGIIADENVNAYKAKEVGQDIINNMKNKVVSEYSFKRKDQLVTLGTKNNIKIDGDEVHVDSQLLFQRLITVADNALDDTEEIFMYELCGSPSSLFDSSGLLREAQKPVLAKAIWDHGVCGVDSISDDNVMYVLDGGSLVQRIPWVCGSSFNTICSNYTEFVTKHYGIAHIVFDGYGNGASIKDVTHERRRRGIQGTKIQFDGTTPFKTKKESVLSNDENKQRFVNLLSEHLKDKGCNVSNACGDADALIVETAVQSAIHAPTVVIGEDTDLLVLLCYHADVTKNNLYFMSDSKNSLKKKKIWDIKQTKRSLGADMCKILPFVHAFSGCDTTSRLYGLGKGVVLKKAISDSHLKRHAGIFINKVSSQSDIETAGNEALKCLYSGRTNETLNTLRYRRFVTKAYTSKNVVQVQTLPPTESAAKYHSFRVYAQVQIWIGNDVNPLDWGWCKIGGKFVPIKTDLPAAPERLLKIIRCNCKLYCDSKRCTCRKHGLSCTVGCGECRGSGCSNSIQMDTQDLNEI